MKNTLFISTQRRLKGLLLCQEFSLLYRKIGFFLLISFSFLSLGGNFCNYISPGSIFDAKSHT